MGRQPKTDPVITLIVLLINAIVWLFKAIFFFIGELFKPLFKEQEVYDTNVEMEDYKLQKIGVETANCPYCDAILDKFPQRKSTCKKCGGIIYIRTRPIDQKKVLLKETELALFDKEHTKRQEYCSSLSLVGYIDITNELQEVIKILKKDYKKYCDYDEILHIPEELRLEIMEFVWNDCGYRDTDKRLYNLYPDLNKKELKFIAEKEWNRVNSLVKVFTWNCETKDFSKYSDEVKSDINKSLLQVFVFGFQANDYLFRLCLAKDAVDVYNMWKDKYGRTYFYDFKPFDSSFLDPNIELDNIYFWQDGSFKKYTLKEFKELCKKNKYNL